MHIEIFTLVDPREEVRLDFHKISPNVVWVYAYHRGNLIDKFRKTRQEAAEQWTCLRNDGWANKSPAPKKIIVAVTQGPRFQILKTA